MAQAAWAQSANTEAKMEGRLKSYFAGYKPKGQELEYAPQMVRYKLDNSRRTLTIVASDIFACQEFTQKATSHIYRDIRKEIPKPYRDYTITVVTAGMAIEELIPNRLSDNNDKTRLWGDIEYDGQPWVSNTSAPERITHGLQNRHIALWASHGRYFDGKKGVWKWQRPQLFGTTEDLFTHSLVEPYIIPMLENAGAVVFTPRERDSQLHEVIVDNDDPNPATRYIEVDGKQHWTAAPERGFASHDGAYTDGENPFAAGTARMARTTGSKKHYSLISYQPELPVEGRYAVYVSYQTTASSVDDAHYTVWHKGEKTEFRVNQQMGGGTWVYLGTFDFDKGAGEYNRVTVTNRSGEKGVVTSDAVRFGGGMGNIERGEATSGMPRCLEGARYYAQWAGMPYSVYSPKSGTDDYADDINVRSHATNFIGGGSCYMPSLAGKKVPIELSLGIHSDAGYSRTGEGLIGSLAICTTRFNDGRLNAGISRLASRDLAKALLDGLERDIKLKYGQWNKRELLDKNYSESRLPEVPAAILETMSHQNFPDMMMGQDPNFKFTLARSVYKTILRYICNQHNRPYIVTPLAPDNFCIDFIAPNKVRLSWNTVNDPQEGTSRPTEFIVYTACGSAGFDNGTLVKGRNHADIELEPSVLYRFKVAAANRGGKSFCTNVLCALHNPNATKTVMIVDGFNRLSAPAVRNTATQQGFDFDDDPGVTLGPTLGWCGRQADFDRSMMGIEGEGGLGYSNSDFAGKTIAGNNMDNVTVHAKAIQAAGRYSIASCSAEAIESGKANLSKYMLADIVLGLQRNSPHGLKHYKTFSTTMQNALKQYADDGGALLVSGAYVASDMTAQAEQAFVADVLGCRYGGTYRSDNDSVTGMGTTLQYHNKLNAEQYAATSANILLPENSAFAAMLYAGTHSACVARQKGGRRSFVMGFPFECIKTEKKRNAIMDGALRFLVE